MPLPIAPGTASPMSNRRERRAGVLAARRAARRGLESCSVPYCTEYGKKLSGCTHAMCEKCILNSIGALDFDELQPRFAFKCAICRYRYNVGAETTKTLMAKLVPTTRRKEEQRSTFLTRFAASRWAKRHLRRVRTTTSGPGLSGRMRSASSLR